jgi:hypothetical protein
MRDQDDRPEDAVSEASQARLAGVAVGLVVPGYLLIGWLISRFMGPEPLFGGRYRFLAFAAGCAVGLAAALYSFRARAGQGTRFLVALGLSELPALLGLAYFVVYRDWIGFAILLSATATAFLVQALRARPR